MSSAPPPECSGRRRDAIPSRIYGLEPASFVPSVAGYLERVHPDERDRVRAEVERNLRSGEPFGVRGAHRPPDRRLEAAEAA
jgi:hypothetical protein